jgi:hypothetical protein
MSIYIIRQKFNLEMGSHMTGVIAVINLQAVFSSHDPRRELALFHLWDLKAGKKGC